MQLILDDELVSAARLTEAEARLIIASYLLTENRLTLEQAARLADLNPLAFQDELTARHLPRA